MIAPSIWLDYRPVRIGWVIGEPSLDTTAMAAQLSTCLWGGRFNPIIPAYKPGLAETLITTFGIDVLHPLDSSKEAQELVKKYSSRLITTALEKYIFNAKEKFCQYADIYHPSRRLAREKQDHRELAYIKWRDDDPLAQLLSLTFGKHPSSDVTGTDYASTYIGLSPKAVTIKSDEPLPVMPWNYVSPINFTTYFLRLYGEASSWLSPGIQVGDVSNIDDLINFWNFRAAGANLLFYDPNHHDRLALLIGNHASAVRASSEAGGRFYVWSRNRDEPIDKLNLTELRISRCGIDLLWNGLKLKPVKAYFNRDHHDVLSNFSESNRVKTATFSLPELPFYKEARAAHMQKFILSIRCMSHGLSDEFTFNTPFFPALNEFYGRNFSGRYSEARSETNFFGEPTLGVITNITRQRGSVAAIDVQKFWKEIFSLADLEFERNEPGHRCANLIRQLGGLQGCRVLKIPGLRKLVHKYSQDQSFTQSAQQIIWDKDDVTGMSSFSLHEDLAIEYRPSGGRLSPQDVFTYMVKRGLFRVGLDIKCTECFLENWIHLDELKSVCTCNYCGNDFNITPFLRNRDWRYRRSGIIGLPRDKLDSISVALTLQQLDTCFHDVAVMYSTSANIMSKNQNVETCEVDFLLMLNGRQNNEESPIQILIGECKSDGGVIDGEDVRKMKKLATELEEKVGQTYILFSKTGPYSEDEIKLIQSINEGHRSRAIIWGPDQLEPYMVYERAKEGSVPHPYANSLSDMAHNSSVLFFPNLTEVR